MKKQKILAVLLILMTGMGFLASAQVYGEERWTLPRQDMPLGERLVYKISWLGIPVGTGELWAKEKMILNGREVIHVVGIIETNKVLRKIFPMHNEAHSWIDSKTFEPLQFEKKTDELTNDLHEKVVFDSVKGIGHFESFKTGEKKEFKVIVPVHDVLSAFYWVRRQVLVLGKPAQTVLTAEQKNWELSIHVLKKETVKMQGKKIETLRVEPTTVTEGKTRKGKAWFNITTDASQTPVRIIYHAPFGPITGTLQQASPHKEPGSSEG